MPTTDWLPGSGWCRGGRRSFHTAGLHTDVNSREAHLGERRRHIRDTRAEGDEEKRSVYLLVGLGDSVGMDGSETFSLVVAGAVSSWRGKVDCSTAS